MIEEQYDHDPHPIELGLHPDPWWSPADPLEPVPLDCGCAAAGPDHDEDACLEAQADALGVHARCPCRPPESGHASVGP